MIAPSIHDQWTIPFAKLASLSLERPNSSVRRVPLTGPEIWDGSKRNLRRWILTDAMSTELAQIDGGVQLETPHLDYIGDCIKTELRYGPGIVVFSGLPVDRLNEAQSSLLFFRFARHIGRVAQLREGGGAIDEVYDRKDPELRGYQNNATEGFHCGFGSALALLCYRQAPEGGENRLVSSGAVYNELLRQRPDWIDRLYMPWSLDGNSMVPLSHYHGRLTSFYHWEFLRDCAVGWEHDLLDLYNEIADSMTLQFKMEPGDIAFIHNPTVLHARNGFTDDSDTEKCRKLFRMFLVL